MPVKKKITGSGFTKERRLVICGPFGDEEIQALKESFNTREDNLDMIERNCQLILQKAEMPDSQRLVVWREGGRWREAPDGFSTKQTPGDESISSLAGRVGHGRQFAEDSEVGYASRMLSMLTSLRVAINNGDADGAGRHGLYLGALWREADMKRRVEPPAIRGRPFEKGPQNQRLNDLGKAIARVLDDLGDDAAPQAVWDELLVRADSGNPPYHVVILDHVENENGRLTWECRSTGKEISLNFESFKKRLRVQKKKRKGNALSNK